jgi:hypothetical protein
MPIMCLSLNGVPLTPQACDALLAAAQVLYQDEGQIARVECEHCDGQVFATGKELVIDEIPGAIFTAYISLGSFIETAIVSFLVSYDELTSPVDELDEEEWHAFKAPLESLPQELVFAGEGQSRFLN